MYIVCSACNVCSVCNVRNVRHVCSGAHGGALEETNGGDARIGSRAFQIREELGGGAGGDRFPSCAPRSKVWGYVRHNMHHVRHVRYARYMRCVRCVSHVRHVRHVRHTRYMCHEPAPRSKVTMVPTRHGVSETVA